ncbi:MAG: MFS transporter [Phycisphaerae bacterium]
MGRRTLSLHDTVTLGEVSAATAPRKLRMALRTRHAAALGVALFLAMLPVTMMVPVLKELISDRFAAGSFWTHSFMSMNMIGAVLFAPLGGALADRLGRRKPILIVAACCDALLLWLMPYLTSLGLLLSIRFLEGGAHILVVTALMAMAGDWADPKRPGRMMGVIGATLIFGTACGAPLGGRIGEYMPVLVFRIGAGLSLTVAILAMIVLREGPMRPLAGRLRDALGLLKQRRELLVPYAYAFIDRFCVGVIVSGFVLFLGEVHGLSPASRGGLLALFLFPFAFLCYPMGRLSDRIGRVMPMCAGSIGFGFVYASYGVLPSDLLPAAMVLSGVLSAAMFAPNLAMCADLAPAKHRATVYAGFNVAGSLGFICGPLVSGWVCGALAYRSDPLLAYQTAFLIAGGAEVLCALVSLPWLLRLRREGRTR